MLIWNEPGKELRYLIASWSADFGRTLADRYASPEDRRTSGRKVDKYSALIASL